MCVSTCTCACACACACACVCARVRMYRWVGGRSVVITRYKVQIDPHIDITLHCIGLLSVHYICGYLISYSTGFG